MVIASVSTALISNWDDPIAIGVRTSRSPEGVSEDGALRRDAGSGGAEPGVPLGRNPDEEWNPGHQCGSIAADLSGR